MNIETIEIRLTFAHNTQLTRLLQTSLIVIQNSPFLQRYKCMTIETIEIG